MSNKQIFIFSDPNDFKSLIESIEIHENLQYCEVGLFDSTEIRMYSTLFDIPDIGHVNIGDWNHCKSYLAFPKGESINIREVPQRVGGIKYAIDQKSNGKSMVVKPGGILKQGIMVAGLIGTISSDSFSMNLFKLFSKMIRKNFTKIGTFYLSPKAKVYLENGWRLVTNDKSPKEYDLKIE